MQWRHPDDGGFRASDYDVAAIPDDTTARTFVTVHHYSRSYPAAVMRFGMYEERTGRLVGVAVLGHGVQELALTNVFPGLERQEALELVRFILLDEVPANQETWLLRRVFGMAAAAGVRGVLSFSDPVPRTDLAGKVVFPGHIGLIYRHKGAVPLGRARARLLRLLPDGTVWDDRTRQKVISGEKGWRYAEELLVKAGATPRRPLEDRRQWREAAEAQVVRRLRHGGNVRYAFPLRRGIRLGLPRTAYLTWDDVLPDQLELASAG